MLHNETYEIFISWASWYFHECIICSSCAYVNISVMCWRLIFFPIKKKWYFFQSRPGMEKIRLFVFLVGTQLFHKGLEKKIGQKFALFGLWILQCNLRKKPHKRLRNQEKKNICNNIFWIPIIYCKNSSAFSESTRKRWLLGSSI